MMKKTTLIVHCIEILLVQSPFRHCMQHRCNTGASFALIAIIIIIIITVTINIINTIRHTKKCTYYQPQLSYSSTSSRSYIAEKRVRWASSRWLDGGQLGSWLSLLPLWIIVIIIMMTMMMTWHLKKGTRLMQTSTLIICKVVILIKKWQHLEYQPVGRRRQIPEVETFCPQLPPAFSLNLKDGGGHSASEGGNFRQISIVWEMFFFGLYD